MMRLYMSDQSPYARKVRAFACERGLSDRIEEVAVVPQDRPTDLVRLNPLSKVPTLVDDEGNVLVDSLAICLHLDGIGDAPPLIPSTARERMDVLRRHAFAHGIMDCTGTRRMEGRLAPDPDRLAWIERQAQTTRRILDHFEETITGLGERVSLDALTLGCALAHLDLRFPDEGWRQSRPRLAAWEARFSERPSMRLTAPRT